MSVVHTVKMRILKKDKETGTQLRNDEGEPLWENTDRSNMAPPFPVMFAMSAAYSNAPLVQDALCSAAFGLIWQDGLPDLADFGHDVMKYGIAVGDHAWRHGWDHTLLVTEGARIFGLMQDVIVDALDKRKKAELDFSEAPADPGTS